ncbi:MAG: hypothetical protein FD167_1942, partial [bacterium]
MIFKINNKSLPLVNRYSAILLVFPAKAGDGILKVLIKFMNYVSRVFALIICFAFFASANLSAVAQTSSKFSFTGIIMDQSGGAISGASVTLREKNTGIERETNTNANGQVIFDNLTSGDYKISVNSSGFSTTVNELVINQDLSKEIVLQAGTITEKITVTATRTESSLLDTAVPVTIIDSKA